MNLLALLRRFAWFRHRYPEQHTLTNFAHSLDGYGRFGQEQT